MRVHSQQQRSKRSVNRNDCCSAICVTCPKINWRFECENGNAWHAYQLGITMVILLFVVVVVSDMYNLVPQLYTDNGRQNETSDSCRWQFPSINSFQINGNFLCTCRKTRKNKKKLNKTKQDKGKQVGKLKGTDNDYDNEVHSSKSLAASVRLRFNAEIRHAKLNSFKKESTKSRNTKCWVRFDEDFIPW